MGRFALVGVVATGIHYSILLALVHGADTGPAIATTIGYAVSIVFSYVLNRRFTFHVAAPIAASFIKFTLLYGIGAGLNAWIVHALTDMDAALIAAQLIASAAVLVWNYLGARFVVFR